MLEMKRLREDGQAIEKKLKMKVADCDVQSVLSLDAQLKDLITKQEELKSKRNALSKEIGLKKSAGENTDAIMEEVGGLGDQINFLSEKITPLQEKFDYALAILPNIPMDEVKESLDPADNECIHTHLEKPSFNFESKNHMELNEKLNLFDFPRGAKVTGSGWPVYRGWGARLEWALINYMIETHVSNGFEQIIPPHIVKSDMLYGAGQFPKFKDQVFKLDDEDYPFYMIPTAEVALNGLHSDEIIDDEQLPIKYASYTPCFRREAGAAGSGERGLIRTHQFNKVEMFCFTTPEQSDEVFNGMIKSAEAILEGLGLHYRSMRLVTGDMSFAAACTVDIEAWLPGQNRYYEVSSVSNCTDYQARRAKIRCRTKGDKPRYLHTLNGSGLATSRLMVALLENNQRADGSIVIPQVLQKYLDGKTELSPEG